MRRLVFGLLVAGVALGTSAFTNVQNSLLAEEFFYHGDQTIEEALKPENYNKTPGPTCGSVGALCSVTADNNGFDQPEAADLSALSTNIENAVDGIASGSGSVNTRP